METKQLSKTKVDKLGEQLRTTEVTEELLGELELYRSEFSNAYMYVERILTDKLLLKVTGRPSKSTLSIIEKLKRINSRLSQVQDIAGCRVIATSLADQDAIVAAAKQWFRDITVDDKRDDPTHGYRAVHLLVKHQGKTVEIQVRTRLQHFWASMSEKLADEHGQEIKYGRGAPEIIKLLSDLSEASASFDQISNDRLAVMAQIDIARRQKRHDLFKSQQKKLKSLDFKLRNAMYRTRIIVSTFDEEQNK